MQIYRYNEFDWVTPDWLYEWLDDQYLFELDVAASRTNSKCAQYLSEHALSVSWNASSIWMHPPSVRDIGLWVRRAYNESQHGKIVVCMLPVRTDTAWFHEYCAMANCIMYLRGRIEAIAPLSGVVGKAGFPHMIVVFDGREIDTGHRVMYVNSETLRGRYNDNMSRM